MVKVSSNLFEIYSIIISINIYLWIIGNKFYFKTLQFQSMIFNIIWYIVSSNLFNSNKVKFVNPWKNFNQEDKSFYLNIPS